MTMENSSLNASHRYARQANKFFRNAKFDEAIQNHELARIKIDEAMLTVTVPRVLESLRLQKQFHTKQIDLVIVRREQYEKCLVAQAAVDKGSNFRNDLDASRQVQVELFKTLDNVEKVVEVLEQKTLTGANKEASEFLSKLFEDLKLLNHQSLILVNRLVTQLDDRITENEELRDMLEENSMKVPPRTSSMEKGRPLSDSDPDLHALEELAPLDLPKFDFNTFSALSSPEAKSPERGAGGGVVSASTKDSETLRRIGFSSLEDKN